jgi:DNA-binding MarR family transcriptional regulator
VPTAVRPERTASGPADRSDSSALTALAVDLLVSSARFTRLASRESDLTIPHALWRALSQFEELGPMRISEFAQVDRCSQPTATTTVQRLEERGWVERAADASDARAVLVSITATGREQLQTNRQVAGERLAVRMGRLDEADRIALARAVRALHHLIDHTNEEHE